jgi:transposase
MAMCVARVIVGVDVAKEWIEVNEYGREEVERVANVRRDLKRWLAGYPVAALAVESTNTYHELLIELALEQGLTVYLISGYQLSRYAESLNVRMRNDRVDAKLLARFLEREIDELHCYQPKPPALRQLWELIKRRAILVKHNTQLTQSLATLSELQSSVRALIRANRRLVTLIEQRMRARVRQLGWQGELDRLRTLPGVGELSALVLLVAYRTHPFANRDAFTSFMGLDLRTKDTGKHRGKRKLTKKGDPEYRRVLYNAAMAATRDAGYFRRYYEQLCQRGIPTTGAFVAVARKLVQLAFVLLNTQTDFDPNKLKGARV